MDVDEYVMELNINWVGGLRWRCKWWFCKMNGTEVASDVGSVSTGSWGSLGNWIAELLCWMKFQVMRYGFCVC